MTTKYQPPTELNGYPVVCTRSVNDEENVVLVHRPGSVQQYVTAVHFRDEKVWYWGHYFDRMIDALKDYNTR